MKAIGLVLISFAMAAVALASDGVRVPEIDGASATGALFLISGVVLVARTRMKKK